MPMRLNGYLPAVGIAAASLLIGVCGAFAQNGEIPAGAGGLPTAEEEAAFRAEFESRFGGPLEMPTMEEPAIPEAETPGVIPDDVRQMVGDAPLVEIVCNMTRWKSGDFFSAMDAVKKYVTPLKEKAAEVGIEVSLPDTDALKAEGQQKLEAICGAGTYDQARQLADEFAAWGKQKALDQFADRRRQFEQFSQSSGDKIRAEIQAAIDPIVSSEKERITAVMEAEAARLGSEAKATFSGRTSAPSESEIAQLTASIESQLRARAAQESQTVQSKVEAKVSEVLGDRQAKFEEIGRMGKSIGPAITADIKAGAAAYVQYRDRAFQLRKEMILKMVDSSLAEGMRSLEAAAGDLDAARSDDPSIPTVEGIKAEMARDRVALEVKIQTAIVAEDEAALSAAIDDFRGKWEGYRAEMEFKAVTGIEQGCRAALAQFGPAKAEIDANLPKIRGLLDDCAGQTDDRCLKVQELAPRLGTIAANLEDIRFQMDAAERMCADPASADRQTLMALLTKIRTDAENAQTYGKALEAEKTAMITDAVAGMCGQALPQIEAGLAETKSADIGAFERAFQRCGQGIIPAELKDYCASIKNSKATFDGLMKRVDAMTDQLAEARRICAGAANDETSIESLATVLYSLRDEGEALRGETAEFRSEQEASASAVSFCRAAKPLAVSAREKSAAGLKQFRDKIKECEGRGDKYCLTLYSWREELTKIETQVQQLLQAADAFDASCVQASDKQSPSPDQIKALDGLKTLGDAVQKAVDEIYRRATEAAAGNNSIWIEAESASSFNRRVGVDDPMAREYNPSWRPPYFGNGSWYMGRGGDYLEYQIEVPAAGKYKLWVRDYSSNLKNQQGNRGIIISFDGKVAGKFSENTFGFSVTDPKGYFGWHKLTEVSLPAGKVKMKIVKTASTNAAAIPDVFYLTTGNDALQER